MGRLYDFMKTGRPLGGGPWCSAKPIYEKDRLDPVDQGLAPLDPTARPLNRATGTWPT